MHTTTGTLIAALSLGAAGCLAQPGFDDDQVAASESALTRSDLTDQVPWAVHIQTSKGCSASVLSSHWILTAAHCVNVAQSTAIDVSVSGLPATPGAPPPVRHLYGGAARYFPHPSWDPNIIDTDSGDDIGLVHLEGAGISIPLTGQAALFADNREPWAGTWPNRYFHIVGYGRGTDANGSSDCDDGVSRGKRIGYGFQVDDDHATKSLTAPYGATHPCPGDSGAPWLFARGPSTPKQDMVFGVMSSLRTALPLVRDPMWAAMVKPKVPWIESTSHATAHPLSCLNHLIGDWVYKRCDEPAVSIDPGPVVVTPVGPAVLANPGR